MPGPPHSRRSGGAGGRVRLGFALVRGRSMEPTLRDGDRLLVAHGATARPGRLAVVRFADGVVAVKRLDHVEGAGWWVSRDNPQEGRDSWSGGTVAESDVLALVVGRVWPRPRVWRPARLT